MSISGISAYSASNLINLASSVQGYSDVAQVSQAVLADGEIEDVVEISVAALKMSEQAAESVAMQLIQGIAQL